MEFLKTWSKQASDHLNEVKHLMNSPRTSLDVVNNLWSTLDSLVWLVRQASPTYDRNIFLKSLYEIKNRQIPSLCHALRELEKEIPDVYGSPTPERDNPPTSPPTA
jgi:hypothetical protein